ncbi:MAG: restriction endonuclease [Salinibacterium amurskyense]
MTFVHDETQPRAPHPSEQSVHAQMTDLGTEKGQSYERVWDPAERVIEALARDLVPVASELAGSVEIRFTFDRLHSTLYFLAGLGFFIWAMVLSTNGYSSVAGFPVLLWFVTSAFWFKSLWKDVLRREQMKKQVEDRATWLTEVALEAAADAFLERRNAARAHSPIEDPSLPFIPRGSMPQPQQFGVSHQGAEALCAEWMRFYGEEDAETTRFTADGGIDVTSLHYIAQVKNYVGTVGVAEVREMAGVALDDGRKALFFTSGSYAAGAIAFADRVGMPLFIYDAAEGSLAGVNQHAESIFVSGL